MLRNIGAGLILAATLLLSGHTAAECAAPPALVVAAKLPAAGGPAQDAVWKLAPAIPRFYFTRMFLQTQDDRTQVRFAYDETNLYVAFRSDEKTASLVAKGADNTADVMKDDGAFIVIDTPGKKYDATAFYANIAGKRFAQHTSEFINSRWEKPFSASASKQADGWSILMTIPFSSLNMTAPSPGTTLSVGLEHVSSQKKGAAFWCKAVRGSREWRARGTLVFGGSDWARVSLPDITVTTPGRQSADIAVDNVSGKPAELKIEVLSDGKLLQSIPMSAKPGRSTLTAAYAYPLDGWHDLNLSVSDSNGRVLARTVPIAVRIAPFRSRLETCKSLIDAATPTSGKLDKSTYEKQVAEALELTRHAEGDPAKWKALGPKVDAVEKDIAGLRAACADIARAGYAVGTETALTKVMRDRMFTGDYGKPARLELARNEFESTQVVVVAYDRNLDKVEVSASDLKGPGKATITSDRIQLNYVDFVNAIDPPYESEYWGWYPDPLMELKPFDVAKGALRPIWVTVHAPTGIPGGMYTGTITVKPANAAAAEVPIEVKVFDFDVPTKPHLKTAFAFSEAELKTWYGRDITHDELLAWYQLLLDHRINPTNIYSKTPVPTFENMQFAVDRGLNAFTLCVTWAKDGDALKGLLDRIKGYQGPLQEKGWWDMAYVYGFDELGPDRFDGLNSTYGAIKKAFPGLPTMTTIVPTTALKGSVDIWVPLTGNYDPEWCNQFVKDGDQVWWYICCHPLHPFPNYFVDYPAIDPRILSWMNWKYQVPGILYYMMDLWASNRVTEGKGVRTHDDPAALKAIAEGKRWPEIPWNAHTCAGFNGDGHLLYPGPNAKPYSSIRLESIRDGIDDYEYLYQLNELVTQAEKTGQTDPAVLTQAKQLIAVPQQVVGSTTEYTLDPNLLYGTRRQIAEMIEKLTPRG